MNELLTYPLVRPPLLQETIVVIVPLQRLGRQPFRKDVMCAILLATRSGFNIQVTGPGSTTTTTTTGSATLNWQPPTQNPLNSGR